MLRSSEENPERCRAIRNAERRRLPVAFNVSRENSRPDVYKVPGPEITGLTRRHGAKTVHDTLPKEGFTVFIVARH